MRTLRTAVRTLRISREKSKNNFYKSDKVKSNFHFCSRGFWHFWCSIIKIHRFGVGVGGRVARSPTMASTSLSATDFLGFGFWVLGRLFSVPLWAFKICLIKEEKEENKDIFIWTRLCLKSLNCLLKEIKDNMFLTSLREQA